MHVLNYSSLAVLDIRRHGVLDRGLGLAGEKRGDVFLLFEFHEGRRDYTMDGVGTGEGDESAGKFAHQADGTTAVNERYRVLVEGVSEGAGGFKVGWGSTGKSSTTDF